MNDGLSVIFSVWLSHDTALKDYGNSDRLWPGGMREDILHVLYINVSVFKSQAFVRFCSIVTSLQPVEP